jgi:hypothetical protein
MSGGTTQMNGNAKAYEGQYNRNDSGFQTNRRTSELIEDLEDEMMPGAIPTISNQVNNHVALANGHLGRNNNHTSQGRNGHVPNGRPDFRSMLEDAEMDSHI